MSRMRVALFALLLLTSLALVACGGKAEPTPRPPIPENSVLKITGSVSQEYGWTLEELKAMEMLEVEAQTRDGETKTFRGVSMNALLDVAQPNADATAVQLKADFGYVVDIPLADIRACDQCIVTVIEDKDELLSVMPGFGTDAQVDRLVKMFVK